MFPVFSGVEPDTPPRVWSGSGLLWMPLVGEPEEVPLFSELELAESRTLRGIPCGPLDRVRGARESSIVFSPVASFERFGLRAGVSGAPSSPAHGGGWVRTSSGAESCPPLLCRNLP